MLRKLLTHRAVWLIAAQIVLVVVLTRWVIPPEIGFRWVIASGYWFMLAAVVLFGTALVPVVQSRWRQFRWTGFDRIALAVGILCFGIWTSQGTRGYKILADELLLLGTSMGMHYERAAAYPVRATDIQGPYQILDRVLDKRPLLFPFLTATVHDLTGYRPTNPFYLNLALGAVFLTLAYLLGSQIAQNRWGGLLLMLLFGGLPLMAQQANGGGFELLNLVLLALTGLAMLWYLEDPEERTLDLLVYSGVLLACTRYESAILLVPVAAAVLWGWSRAGRVFVSWRAAITPLFLIPVLMQNLIFGQNSGAWELAGVPGSDSPFGFQYFAVNLGHALNFFFAIELGAYQPSSWWFAGIGLLALPFFGLWASQVVRRPGEAGAREVAWTVFGAGLLAIGLVHLFYFWGQYDHPVIRRLSLPVHLLFGLAVVYVAGRIFRRPGWWHGITFCTALAFLVHGLPVMAKRAYETSYTPGREMEIRAEFLAERPERDFLVIDNDSFFWITHHVPASPVAQIQRRRDSMAYLLKNHAFSDIYVFQSVLVNDQTGERTIDPADDLGADFELETVLEQRVQILLFARISRVTGFHDGGQVYRPTRAVPILPESRNKEEQEKARQQYFESYIKHLP